MHKQKKIEQNIKEKADSTFHKLPGRPESNTALTLGIGQNLDFIIIFP